MTVFKNARINGEITDFVIKDGKFNRIGKTDKSGIDLCGNSVFPGLIDIHTHGCVGFDAMEVASLDEMSCYQASVGVTSWYPTTTTVDFDTIKNTLKADLGNISGANVMGFHLEGPYIAKEYKGAQNGNYIRDLDLYEFNSLNNVKIVTMAPELKGAELFIKNCKALVSLGHTGADYDTAVKAIEAGARCLTHTFNAMSPFHHRSPGVIGAAVDKDIYVSVICDGLHIHKSVVNALYKMFGKKMVLISDSICATGMPDGKYQLSSQDVNVVNGVARNNDGTIAGSTTNLFECVKKAIEFGVPVKDAFYMASTAPAEMMGINKGKIEEGYDADFIVIDNDNNLLKTFIGGNEFKTK